MLSIAGDLTSWAKQGVLLLNAVLTGSPHFLFHYAPADSLSVRAHEANSHANMGWESFTSAVITALSKKRQNLVFLLWYSISYRRHFIIFFLL